MFEEGRGVPRDVAVARRLYEDAVFSEELMGLIVLPEASQGQIPVVIPYVEVSHSEVGLEALRRLSRLAAQSEAEKSASRVHSP